MHDSNLVAIPPDQAIQMHQAGHVHGGQDLRPGLQMIGDPITTHEAGDRLFTDRKRPAKTTAFIRPLQIDQRQAFHRFQQAANLIGAFTYPLAALSQTQFSQTVAGLMQTDLIRKTDPLRTDLQHIDEILAQFIRLAAKLFVLRAVAEILVIVLPHHRDTTAGRADDRIVLLKDSQKSLSERSGIGRTSGVRHRLAAAGLFLGERDRFAIPFQQFDRGHSDLRKELVDITGNKQSNVSHETVRFR